MVQSQLICGYCIRYYASDCFTTVRPVRIVTNSVGSSAFWFRALSRGQPALLNLFSLNIKYYYSGVVHEGLEAYM